MLPQASHLTASSGFFLPQIPQNIRFTSRGNPGGGL